MQCLHGPIGHSVIPGPDAVNQGPWKGLMHEKLGLLPFLNERVAKVSSSNSVPVDPIQVVQIFIPATSFELWSSWTCFGFPCLSVRKVRTVVSLLNPGDQLQRVMHRVGC